MRLVFSVDFEKSLARSKSVNNPSRRACETNLVSSRAMPTNTRVSLEEMVPTNTLVSYIFRIRRKKLTPLAIIGEIGSPFDMKPTALLGLAQGKRHGFKDYVEPSKVSLMFCIRASD
jgi:hypothetical protein